MNSRGAYCPSDRETPKNSIGTTNTFFSSATKKMTGLLFTNKFWSVMHRMLEISISFSKILKPQPPEKWLSQIFLPSCCSASYLEDKYFLYWLAFFIWNLYNNFGIGLLRLGLLYIFSRGYSFFFKSWKIIVLAYLWFFY